MERFAKWRDGEFIYCREVVRHRGNDAVTRNPKTIASYLRLQASSAFHDGEYEIAARLGAAATAINYDARNNHNPDWTRALLALDVPVAVSKGAR